MSKTLTFLHTSPVHIKTFDALLESYPDVPVKHLVHEDLLKKATTAGYVTDEVKLGVEQVIRDASKNATVILCTCSTLGAVSEQLNSELDSQIIRVDRPLAQKALELGERIVVVAAISSTLEPTRDLITDVAKQLSKTPEITMSLAKTAWAHFEAGDILAYHKAIAAHLDTVADQGDVLVLAQASMAGATAYAQTQKPILSSPSLGLEAAVNFYRSLL